MSKKQSKRKPFDPTYAPPGFVAVEQKNNTCRGCACFGTYCAWGHARCCMPSERPDGHYAILKRTAKPPIVETTVIPKYVLVPEVIIYIAGPMRGIPYYNFPAFDAAKVSLQRQFPLAEIISPADLDREAGFDAMTLPATSDWNRIPDNFSFDACVERDIAAVKRCTTIFMLKGYQKSSGAMAELALAKWLGKDVAYESGAEEKSPLPEDAAERKRIPLYSGVVRYFPDALIAVAKVSFEGNEQHHPGTPLHWDKSKSTDEPDALLRHLFEGERSRKARAQVAWRALAWLQRGIDQGLT